MTAQQDYSQVFAQHFGLGICSSCISALIFIHDEFRVAQYKEGQRIMENALAEICVQLIEDANDEPDETHKKPMEDFFRSYIQLSKEERKTFLEQVINRMQ